VPSAESKWPKNALSLAEELISELSLMEKQFAAAESCTAGLVSDLIASIPGASKVFWGSFVTYTNDAKQKMLDVPEMQIREHGPVSRQVALAMAEGALKKSGAALALSVTGLAGPGGDDSAPVGTVWIGIAGWNNMDDILKNGFWSEAKVFSFSGNRNEVREAAAIAAVEEILARIKRK